MKRPEDAEMFLCRRHGRQFIEVGPWLYGAVCPDPEQCKAEGHVHSMGTFGGALKRVRGDGTRERGKPW